MQERIINVEVEKIYEKAEKYMEVMCGFHRNNSISEKSRIKAQKVRDKVFDGMEMPFLVKSFGREQIQDEYFCFDEVRIKCGALQKFKENEIKCGYAFLFRSPMPDIYSLPVSKMYLADSWETCFVDAGRDWLRKTLLEEVKKDIGEDVYITDTLAPGMAGMPVESIQDFFKFMDGSKIGISLLESGMMTPVKSFVGIYLVMNKEQIVSTMNCEECLSGHKFCEYCKNFASVYLEKI